MSEQITHLVIARAADEGPEGRNAQAKIGFTSDPSEAELEDIRVGIVRVFANGFGAEPVRVGVAVLPWIADLDDEESEA